jgi:hypothetical protein
VIVPTTASAAPSVIFCTSTNTFALVAAAISSFHAAIHAVALQRLGSSIGEGVAAEEVL